MLLSPGVSYILHDISPNVFIPLVLTYSGYYLTKQLGYDADIPQWLVSPLGLALSTLFLMLFKTVFVHIRKGVILNRDLQRLGARPFPTVKGKWPGNADIALRIIKEGKGEYAGGLSKSLMQENGDTFCIDILGVKTYWTCNPYHMKEIFAGQFTNFVKGPIWHSIFDSFLGTGIFNSDGDAWKLHRSMTRPFFNRDRIADFDIFEHHSEVLMEKVREKSENEVAFDFQEAISQFTMDSATEFLLGKSVNSLETPLSLPGATISESEVNRFVSAFQATQLHILSRVQSNPVPWQMHEIMGDPTQKDMAVIYAFIDPIIDAALVKAKAQEKEGETLLSLLISETQDRKMIRDEVLNILLAGRDTTASNLTWNIYFLATHPSVLARLRQEILDVVGPNQRPTFDHIKDMKYLRAIINESLRILPSVPNNMKYAVKSTTLTNPQTGVKYFLPAGSRIMVSPLAMQTNPAFWGPTALEYDPERWLDDRNKIYYLANPFIFLPFLAGPRICLGQQFAYNEISFFLIRFLQKVEHIELAPDAQPLGTLPPARWKTDPPTGTRAAYEKVWPRSDAITTYSRGGMWVRVK
ncbi:hypothetical protein FRB94_006131 [Tulasnella sp. JGI-2019a]|nr:hypothetical protein FRB93_006627 [Tulasnella sp. JGI-2019a]KAG8999532.1 hypothetical protein FRB94_006131 [Tulasnella sp. JGI-2019a]